MNHPLDTEKDAEHYVARLGQVSARMDDAIAEARGLAAKNMIPPRFILRATIVQMQPVHRDASGEESVRDGVRHRMAAAKAVPDARREELRAQAEKIVATQVYPAWKRGIALLEPLVGRANDDAGLWRFKGGDDAYTFALRRFTTTNLTRGRDSRDRAQAGRRDREGDGRRPEEARADAGDAQGTDQGARRRARRIR